MKHDHRRLALLFATALTLPSLPAAADVAPPPNVLPNTFSAPSYGNCIWDAAHDAGACINAAIAAASTAGGGTVVVPIGNYGLTTTITLADKVKITGAGGADYARCATTLTWIGASSGVIAQGGDDSSASQVVGTGLANMCLDGATLAATGLKLRSVVWSEFADLYVKRVTAAAYDLDVSQTANIGVMFNKFTRTYADLLDASAATAIGWQIGNGTSTANTNRNLWLQPIVTYQNGKGFVCGNMDSNDIIGADVEPANGGTGTSLDLLGSATAANRTCRSNRFTGQFGASSAGAAIAETNTFPSVKNTLFLNQESGAPNPTINSAASLYWSNNNGVLNGGWTMGSALNVASGGTGRTTLSSGALVVGNGTAGLNTLNLIKYGGGCTLSNDGTTPNTVIDIAPCMTSEDNTNILMNQTAAYTKTTGAWAVGNGNGCLDTGTVANATWYYLYQIQRSDNGTVDYLCTTSFGSPTMPANYNRKRYIGPVKTDGSGNILGFKQLGNEFVWSAAMQDVALTGALGTSSALQTLASVPGGYQVEAHLRAEVFKSANSPKVLLTAPDEADNAVDNVTGNQSIQGISATGTSGTFRIRTNTAQQIRAISNLASTSLWIVTVGWKDPLIAWQH